MCALNRKLPKSSSARQLATLEGWLPDELANEVAGLDGVDFDEALWRVEEAIRQRSNRQVGQKMRHVKKRLMKERFWWGLSD